MKNICYNSGMKYIIRNKGINVKSSKQWLTRNNYSKDAVKVLGALAKTDIVDPSDIAVATSLKMSSTRYKDAKRSLVFCGLLEVHKINSYTLVYLVGEKAIVEFHKMNEGREMRRVHRLALDSIGLTEELEDEPIDTEIHCEIDYDYSTVEKPTPINITEEDIL